jgi:formate hydrogenlyase subunit 6/NADH:ubiquinone oxidoreductase subunit I
MGKSYWYTIWQTLSSLWTGLKVTFRHFRHVSKRHSKDGIQSDNYFEQSEGLMTVQYPHESLPVPDNGRYRLHNEIDDCIVCDKCAKVCPVDCIEIDAIKSSEVFGETSDGTPKRIYAARFDIDMAKCCFCGLCTTVCPTECLTMTKAYDFSEFDVIDHIYSFAEMSPEEIAAKRAEAEQPTGQTTSTTEKHSPMPIIKPVKKRSDTNAGESDD